MHDTGSSHTHEPAKDDKSSAPSVDPKADHDANHKEKVDGCEYC